MDRCQYLDIGHDQGPFVFDTKPVTRSTGLLAIMRQTTCLHLLSDSGCKHTSVRYHHVTPCYGFAILSYWI